MSSIFIPIVGERVEIYLKTKRDWERGVVIAVPSSTSQRFTIALESGETEDASIFDLRPWEPPILHEPTPTDSAPVEEWDGEEDTPVADMALTRAASALDAFRVKDASREQMCAAMLRSLITKGVDPETPGRMVRALEDMTSGYGTDIKALFKTFPVEGDQGIVIVRDVPFASLCEHHVLPFTGTASVAYIPDGKIVGLSKIPRLIKALSRRLQVQERLGSEIANAMDQNLAPKGVMVVLRGRHSCMAIRGVESPGEMVTSYVLGAFKDDVRARSEALQLLRQ